MHVHADPQYVYTAAAAAVEMVVDRYGRGARIFNLSTDGVAEMMREYGLSMVEDSSERCDAVIVGAPYNAFATEDRRRQAMLLARGGASLVGICADRIFPGQRGLEFGAGALCAMLAYAANSTPVFAGKPEPDFYINLCKRLNADPSRSLLIGDNLESDVAGAKRVGVSTILVLTGVARREDLLDLADDKRPDWVARDSFEIAQWME